MPDITNLGVKTYLEESESALNSYRTVIIFGKNVATYKFAFCDALLKQGRSSHVTYDDLCDDFIHALLDHFGTNPHQFQKRENKLTVAMEQYAASDKSQSEWTRLRDVAETNIYNNVFDAFQNVGNGTLDNRYRLFEHDKKNKKLVLTDNTNSILDNPELREIVRLENQSRWNVVEEAWRSGLSPNLLEYNNEERVFYSGKFRVGLRSAVDVLMPYQKERCFYCNRELKRFFTWLDDAFPDVDHVLPVSMSVKMNGANPNGVWNLVLACRNCNRGGNGKFDMPPDKQYFKKLADRNALFVEEHTHSLRNSILLSLNVTNRVQVLSAMDGIYRNFEMIRGWKPKHIYPN